MEVSFIQIRVSFAPSYKLWELAFLVFEITLINLPQAALCVNVALQCYLQLIVGRGYIIQVQSPEIRIAVHFSSIIYAWFVVIIRMNVSLASL